jgi:hypothetical protein
MEKDIQQIKNLYEMNIILFNKLLECVNLERETLINMDIKGLWALMTKKQEIMEAIEETGNQLRIANKGDDPYQNIPSAERPEIRKLSQKLTDLKLNTMSIIKGNVSFINESIDFFHEIISIFTKPGNKNDSYGPSMKSMMNHSNLIYHNEV